MNSKGFTLMEILAVLLILAVVVMFAIPGIRAIRNEVYYYQAKSAAVKMADAMRSYYHDTKGYRLVNESNALVGRLPTQNEVRPRRSVVSATQEDCNNVAASGIPSGVTGTSNLSQLFACDYLSVKDFSGLPYTFISGFGTADALVQNPEILVQTTGLPEAGRHSGEGWCVYTDASVVECEEEQGN